jgi:hypothetical protein
MGLLITLTLAFAFVAELLLLPALVLMIMPRAKSSTNEVDGRR